MKRDASFADMVNQERLVAGFLELAQVSGSSGDEKRVADFVQDKLTKMSFSVEYDDAHLQTGGNCGNLFARWDGVDSSLPSLLFSTHLDTVLPTEGLRPIIRDGNIYSDGTTILGADDRAALASYLEAIQVIQEGQFQCGGIELILTVSEQTSLLGSKFLNYSKVKSKAGYVFDSSGDVGQIILSGPFGEYLHWSIQGKPAHLGLAAKEGISAIVIAADAITQMKLGQIDDFTVANIGKIQGGELGSIIPGCVKMLGEVRSYTLDTLEQQVKHMCDIVQESARRHAGTVNVRREKKYSGYDIPLEDEHVQIAVRAAKRLGIQPYFTKTLGGADTNNFREHGLTVFTLGNGFQEIHSFNEHISNKNLVDTARLTVSLVEEFTITNLKRSQ
jgi:tripeptide aminopeptidase